MYKLFLTLRYLRKRRIAYFAVGAVMLCSAMVLIVMSVLGGFVKEMKGKARVLLGDIILDNRSYHGFPLYQEFIDEISTWPEIHKATPVIYSWGLLRFPRMEQTNTVRVVGLRLNEVYEVNGFKPSLYYENQYPGTTTLAEQQQPVLGVTGTPSAPRLRLPAPLHSAWEQAQAAGVKDDATYDDRAAQIRKQWMESGMPPYPGAYSLSPDENDQELEPHFVGPKLGGLIIGREIAAIRQPDGSYQRPYFYPRGFIVTLTLVPTSEQGDMSQPVKVGFRYVDDSRTGVYEVDSQQVYCDFEKLQKLLQLDAAERTDGGMAPARCSQIQVKLNPGFSPDEVAVKLQGRILNAASAAGFVRLEDNAEWSAAALSAMKKSADNRDTPFMKAAASLAFGDGQLLSRVRAETWEQSQRRVLAPIEKERALMQIILGIISLVACVLVLCILYMIVLQKTRDIGVLKSIGASSSGVGAIFVSYGAAVGVVGGAVGVAIGWVFMIYINEIQDLLIRIDPSLRVWDFSVYAFDKIPNHVDIADAITVFITAIVACTAGSFAAAWRAASMEPVEALRFE